MNAPQKNPAPGGRRAVSADFCGSLTPPSPISDLRSSAAQRPPPSRLRAFAGTPSHTLKTEPLKTENSPLSAFHIDHLPGADLIHRGLQDHHARRHTIESHLVEIARPRLERAGLLQPAPHRLDSEIQLYQLLARDHPNPYGRYNSLLRELISFEHALDHRLAKENAKC